MKEQKEKFEEYISSRLAGLEEGKEEIRRILLGIYANPIESKLLFAAE